MAFGKGEASTTHTVYDDAGRKTDVTTAYNTSAASTTHYTYYLDGRVENVTIASNSPADATTTHYVYDAAGHTTDVTVAYGTADASTTHSTYYDSGLLQSTTTAYGTGLAATTTYYYDTRGRAYMTQYPDGTTSHQLYDLTPNTPGWMNATVDQAGVMTSSIYDEAGRLEQMIVSAVDPQTQQTLQHISHYQYDAANRLTDSFDPLNHHTSYTYYPTGQMQTSTSWLDATTPYTTTYEYNLAGEQVSVTDANGHLTQYQYNERGLLQKTIYPPVPGDTGEVSTSQTYDLVGRLITSTDENGIVTCSAYNAAGRLTGVTFACGTGEAATTQYGYNVAGQLTSILDPKGQLTTFEYNHAGQQVRKILPDEVTYEQFHYNAAGNMDSHRLEDGNTNTYTYDNMNRLTEIAYFDGQYANFTYTDGGQRETASTRTQGPAIPQVTGYTYDPFQRLEEVTAPDGVRAVSYTYTDNDLRETMTTPAGTTTYGYDALDRLTSISNQSLVTSYQYDPVGFLVEKELPNGVKTVYTPNARNRLTNVTSRNASNAVLQSFDYELDNAGNRQSVTESGGGTITWTYDKLYRLTDEVRPGTTTHFEYDDAGNRNSMTVNGVTTNYTYNSLDQLTSAGSVTYDYDGRGNLEQITNGSQLTNYTWDAADRLATVSGPSSNVQFAYDADGRRVKQTAGSQTINYLWDEASAYGDVVLETDGSGSTLASYVLAGTQLVSQTRGSTTNYYLQDGQGSTRALTNAAGTVTDTYSYTAFGELLNQTGSTANNYLYIGQQFDALTGLYDLRARYYHPALGRFLSQDMYPVNFGNPVELNRYVYTSNNPANRIDPTGYLFFETAVQEEEETKVGVPAATSVGLGLARTSAVILYLLPAGGTGFFAGLSTAVRIILATVIMAPMICMATCPQSYWQSQTQAQTQTQTQASLAVKVANLQERVDEKLRAGGVVVELGAGDYSNAITTKRRFPMAHVIATNLISEWQEGKMFFESGILLDSDIVKLYQGWLKAKEICRTEMLCVDVGETTAKENWQVPPGIADLVYTVFPVPASARSFGVSAARIANMQQSGTIVSVTGGPSGSAYDFMTGFKEASPYPVQFTPYGNTTPFGATGSDWEGRNPIYDTWIYIVP